MAEIEAAIEAGEIPIELEADEIPIEALLDHGIHARDVSRVLLSGFETCNMVENKEMLNGIHGITDATAEAIWRACEKLVMENLNKQQVFHATIEDLKLQLQKLAIQCGKKGALLVLEDKEGAETELVLPFPSDKELRWANLCFKTELEDKIDAEDLICAKLEKTKWEMESKIFQRYV